MIDLDELERIAKAATPGRWYVEQDHGFNIAVVGISAEVPPDPNENPDYHRDNRIVETDSGVYPPRENDAAHIVAAQPAVVLALIAELRAYRDADSKRHEAPIPAPRGSIVP